MFQYKHILHSAKSAYTEHHPGDVHDGAFQTLHESCSPKIGHVSTTFTSRHTRL